MIGILEGGVEVAIATEASTSELEGAVAKGVAVGLGWPDAFKDFP